MVVRATKVDRPPSPEASLALLLAGPDEQERRQGFTSELPAGPEAASPAAVAVGPHGLTVTVAGAVRALAPDAADQIICTVADTAAQEGRAEYFVPVTIVGSDGARPARPCSIR
ncbi:hypothetical protein JNW91_19130 [Micromonospora sp. STR1_7]|uniref:Uncharacterized protein n=1 Tax=Micromonospora parastrephiae TaxID=2806101 RepID=A0ABS1XX02_9ACTN|nr:hypothetical protein [Micromonospora parastrephiae]MBM0233778.1 hypothetical protein [Micromonospora parastrephiae]